MAPGAMTGDCPFVVVVAMVEAIVDTLVAIHGWWVVHMPFLLRIPIKRSMTSWINLIHVLPTASIRSHHSGLTPAGRIHCA